MGSLNAAGWKVASRSTSQTATHEERRGAPGRDQVPAPAVDQRREHRPADRRGEQGPQRQRPNAPPRVAFDVAHEAVDALVVHDVRQALDADVLQRRRQMQRRQVGVGRERAERRQPEHGLPAAEPDVELHAEGAHRHGLAREQGQPEPRADQPDHAGQEHRRGRSEAMRGFAFGRSVASVVHVSTVADRRRTAARTGWGYPRRMFGRGFRIATIRGVPVNVDSSWIWIAGLLIATFWAQLDREFPDIAERRGVRVRAVPRADLLRVGVPARGRPRDHGPGQRDRGPRHHPGVLRRVHRGPGRREGPGSPRSRSPRSDRGRASPSRASSGCSRARPRARAARCPGCSATSPPSTCSWRSSTRCPVCRSTAAACCSRSCGA